MNDLITIHCACPDHCGMTLTVLPMGAWCKLTMTARPGETREPATEWISNEGLAKRLQAENCELFGVFKVLHYLDDDLDLDMLISDDDRQRLLELAKDDKVTA